MLSEGAVIKGMGWVKVGTNKKPSDIRLKSPPVFQSCDTVDKLSEATYTRQTLKRSAEDIKRAL